MRDVLELRQIKLELAAYMGEELPEPNEHQQELEGEKDQQEQENDIKDLIEINEFSLPTTPALEGSPMLEQLGDITPLASSIRKSVSEEEDDDDGVNFVPCESTVSKSSSSSLKLGPGMQVDLHSLIEPCSSTHAISSDYREDEDNNNNTMFTPTNSSIQTSISSSSYSSPPSSIPGSENNSLSCSPATSDSEFGSGSGTLSSCEEYDESSSSRRDSAGGDTSSYDEEEEEDDDDAYDEEFQNYNNQIINGENARTPTRVSLLRPSQFSSLQSPLKSRRTSLSSSEATTTKGQSGKIDVGCIQIALPALDAAGNDPYDINKTFDLSPSTYPDPWNPSTF